MAGLMFGAAGGLGWVRGWVFLAFYLAVAVVSVAWLWRVNPDVIIARSTRHRGAKGWDTLLFYLLIVSFMAVFPVAAFDDGRFHWSHVPLWLVVVGYVLVLIGTAGNTWVLSVNKFAEPSVRLQTDRQQRVIDTGPYAVVRHPLYATSFFLFVGLPLSLGSYWAFVPVAIGFLAIVVRTVLEDRMLQNELPGYKEYAARVRWRLVPGVW
jgi:protein-S-isoprenylcysteine O-methyltransferase Ste14